MNKCVCVCVKSAFLSSHFHGCSWSLHASRGRLLEIVCQYRRQQESIALRGFGCCWSCRIWRKATFQIPHLLPSSQGRHPLQMRYHLVQRCALCCTWKPLTEFFSHPELNGFNRSQLMEHRPAATTIRLYSLLQLLLCLSARFGLTALYEKDLWVFWDWWFLCKKDKHTCSECLMSAGVVSCGRFSSFCVVLLQLSLSLSVTLVYTSGHNPSRVSSSFISCDYIISLNSGFL